MSLDGSRSRSEADINWKDPEIGIGKRLTPAAAWTGGVGGVGVGSLESELPGAANFIEDSTAPFVVGAREGLDGAEGIGVVGCMN